MSASKFEDMVREDSYYIARTIGGHGRTWGLLKRGYGADYTARTSFSDDSLQKWITRRIFSEKASQPPEARWDWKLPLFPDHQELMDLSNRFHRQLLDDPALEAYIPQWDARNVYDFLYGNIVHHPGRTVADFGAGYGRNAFLYVAHGFNYICLDAIEISYMLQRLVLKRLYGDRVIDYLDDREVSQADIQSLLSQDKECILHLPIWRIDLLPEKMVDVSLFAVSLDEMSAPAARFCLDAAVRLSSDRGVIYFRGNATGRVNYLHLKAYARLHGLYQVLDLEHILPEDSPRDTYLFRLDKRPTSKKLKRAVAPWILYGYHTLLRLRNRFYQDRKG